MADYGLAQMARMQPDPNGGIGNKIGLTLMGAAQALGMMPTVAQLDESDRRDAEEAFQQSLQQAQLKKLQLSNQGAEQDLNQSAQLFGPKLESANLANAGDRQRQSQLAEMFPLEKESKTLANQSSKQRFDQSAQMFPLDFNNALTRNAQANEDLSFSKQQNPRAIQKMDAEINSIPTDQAYKQAQLANEQAMAALNNQKSSYAQENQSLMPTTPAPRSNEGLSDFDKFNLDDLGRQRSALRKSMNEAQQFAGLPIGTVLANGEVTQPMHDYYSQQIPKMQNELSAIDAKIQGYSKQNGAGGMSMPLAEQSRILGENRPSVSGQTAPTGSVAASNSQEDMTALQWAQANPKDPRAQAIIKDLQNRYSGGQ